MALLKEYWWIISPFITLALIPFIRGAKKAFMAGREKEEKRFEKLEESMNNTAIALKHLTCDRIIQGHRYHTAQGYITTDELISLSSLNEAYKGLGGNGTVKLLMKDIAALPIKTKGA